MGLLDKLYIEKGWDFRNYKKTSLARRVSKRLFACNVTTYGDYCAVLDRDPLEYERLFSCLTIKVSEFFREPEVFDGLCNIIKANFSDAILKVWCCGCAYGEEAYSIAILLAECLSLEAIKNTKVFATDIDHDALNQARKALYREDSLKNVPRDTREKYFFRSEGGLYKVNYNIRNLVKFGVLDIVRSPSISGVQILFCRNLFIYFEKHLQEDVFGKLDYSIRPGGILVLGKAEVLPPSFAHRYDTVGDKMNIFRKKHL